MAEALVLAAGRGERMRPLTDAVPKPLLEVGGQSLLAWHLDALHRAGVSHAVINTAWLGEQIPARLGHSWLGSAPAPAAGPLRLSYSMEGTDFGGALETAGGIARALPQLDEVFWVVAGDVFAPGFVFDPAALQRFSAGKALAHLWLVPNPEHNPKGDFGLGDDGRALNVTADAGVPRYTYSTIGLYRRELFLTPHCPIPWGNPQGVKAALAPLLRAAMDAGQVTAELYSGAWTDVGTPERLAQINAACASTPPGRG